MRGSSPRATSSRRRRRAAATGRRRSAPTRPRSRAARACTRYAWATSPSTATASSPICSCASTRRPGPCNWDALSPEGVILYDETAVEIPEEFLSRARPVRMEQLAKEIGGSLRAKNMVAVGRRGRGDRLQHGAHRGAGAPPLRPQAGRGRGQHRGPPRRWARERRPQGLARDRGAGGGGGGPDPDVREPGDRRGRHRRRPDLLRRVPDHPGIGHPRVAVGQAAPGGRPDHPVRGRDRLDLLGARRLLHRRQGDDGDLRAGPLADDRGAGATPARPRSPA